MKASSLSFQAAVLFVLAGMVWGLQMAISNDHSAFPAHAHLNHLGFVSLFLFGFIIECILRSIRAKLHSLKSGLGSWERSLWRSVWR